MIERIQPDRFAIEKGELGNEGILQGAELELRNYLRTGPDIVIGAHITAPDVEMMNFGIVEIGPLALHQDQPSVGDIAVGLKAFECFSHWSFL